MKRWVKIAVGVVSVFAFFALTTLVHGAGPQGELLEYEVISVNPQNWVVTAKETASGNVVKFKLPPSVFQGKSFDAELRNVRQGGRFSVRGPRNARLDNLIMEDSMRKQPRMRKSPGPAGMTPPGGAQLGWVIENVDPAEWIVSARNRASGKTAKFKAHPEAFAGFRFRADLRNISKGQGFSIVAPNDRPMPNACTLMEPPK